MRYKISKKWVILAISILLILVSIPSYSSMTTMKSSNNIKETAGSTNPIREKDRSTHTVFVEYATGQFCGPCHTWSQNLHNFYTSGNYDFEYVSMIIYAYSWSDILFSDAYNWAVIYGVTGGPLPTNIMDGDYQRSTSSTSEFQSDIVLCENRPVPDIEASMSAYWLGDATFRVDISIQNNEATQYNGYIRVPITEITSRYLTAGSANYRYGFLDWAFDQDISINPGQVYTDTTTWNGNNHQDDHGTDFGDITMENIKLIMGVFNDDNDYVDETVAAFPEEIDEEPPEISNVQAIPPVQTSGGLVNITADVTDNEQVNKANVIITYPDLSFVNETMIKNGGDTYYYENTYSMSGTYSYYIWANDPDDNQNVSSSYTFDIVNPHITNLIQTWNFISLPFNQSVDLTDLIINYNSLDYTWSEAIDPINGPIIDPNVYGWDRINQMYLPASTLDPGYGYWMYSYFDCELLGQSITAPPDNYITDLENKWNIIGVPLDQSVNLVDLIVNYGGTDYTWAEAIDPINGPIIDPNVYGWDRTLDMYIPVTTLESGHCYWIYAYFDSILKSS